MIGIRGSLRIQNVHNIPFFSLMIINFQHSSCWFYFLVLNFVKKMLNEVHHVAQNRIELQTENFMYFKVEVKSLKHIEIFRHLKRSKKYVR